MNAALPSKTAKRDEPEFRAYQAYGRGEALLQKGDAAGARIELGKLRNAAGDDPPHIMFSTVQTNHTNKDTLNNILATKQFVVNMVTEALAEQMNQTSKPIPYSESEFELAGLTPIPSILIKPPRVKESPITMECELVHHYSLENHKFGGATIIIGKIVLFHIDESVLLDDYKINMETYKPIARLAGSNYSKLGEIFSIKR